MFQRNPNVGNDFDNESMRLFELAKSGDFLAYAQLYEMYIDSVLSHFKQDRRMDYHDLRQGVFLSTYQKIRRSKNIMAWKTYCRLCAKGLLNDSVKKCKPNLLLDKFDISMEDIEEHNKLYSPDLCLLNKEIGEEISKEVRKLSQDDQQIFVFHFVEDISADIIADTMKIPIRSVYSRIRSVRNKLTKSKTLQELYRNGLYPVLLQSLFEVGNAGTQSVGAVSSKSFLSLLTNSVKWFLSLIGIVFMTMFWMTSFMILSTKGMAEYGRSTQSVVSRAWYIKSIILGYTLVVLFPLILFLGQDHIIPYICDKGFMISHSMDIILGFWIFIILLFVLYFHHHFVRLQQKHTNTVSDDISIYSIKSSLRVQVNIICSLIAFAIVFFCFYYLLGICEYPRNSISFLLKHN